MNKILKDFIVKSRVKLGYRVEYQPGWDCHGLPIELKIAKEAKVGFLVRREERLGIDSTGDPSTRAAYCVHVDECANERLQTMGRLFGLAASISDHGSRICG